MPTLRSSLIIRVEPPCRTALLSTAGFIATFKIPRRNPFTWQKAPNLSETSQGCILIFKEQQRSTEDSPSHQTHLSLLLSAHYLIPLLPQQIADLIQLPSSITTAPPVENPKFSTINCLSACARSLQCVNNISEYAKQEILSYSVFQISKISACSSLSFLAQSFTENVEHSWQQYTHTDKSWQLKA